jgi:predicted nucleic acid-binding protein
MKAASILTATVPNSATTQSIIRDVLIAVSAKHHKVTVISDNEDFPLIAEYYKFRWKTGRVFFA